MSKPPRYTDLEFASSWDHFATNGGTIADVAKQLGISVHTVSKRAKKLRTLGADLKTMRANPEHGAPDIEAINKMIRERDLARKAAKIEEVKP